MCMGFPYHVCSFFDFLYFIYKYVNDDGYHSHITQLVRLLVVEPTHLGSSPRLGTSARIFL
jgi:hypothetical protein